MKERFWISVSYSIRHYEWGTLDEAASAIAKREPYSWGTNFDRRDVGFLYETKRLAMNAIRRFKKDPRFRTDTKEPTDLLRDEHELDHDLIREPDCPFC